MIHKIACNITAGLVSSPSHNIHRPLLFFLIPVSGKRQFVFKRNNSIFSMLLN